MKLKHRTRKPNTSHNKHLSENTIIKELFATDKVFRRVPKINASAGKLVHTWRKHTHAVSIQIKLSTKVKI